MSNISAERIASVTGIEDTARAIETVYKISEAYNRLKDTKIPTNLPWEILRKVGAGLSLSNRGLLYERFECRFSGFTKENIAGKGDALDSHGNRVEIKMTTQGANGRYAVHVRPTDDVAYTHIMAVSVDGRCKRYRISHDELKALPMYLQYASAGSYLLNWSPSGAKAQMMKAFEIAGGEIHNANTGNRLDSMAFLREASIGVHDLDHMVSVREELADRFRGHRKAEHLSLDELLHIKPLFQEGKFGLLFQDWMNDHLEIARAATPGIGDGRGKKNKKVEIKYSHITTDGTRFQVHGVKASDFNEIYIGLDHGVGGEMEIFKISSTQIRKITAGYGVETKPGVFMLGIGAGGVQKNSLLTYLRRYYKVDLNVATH